MNTRTDGAMINRIAERRDRERLPREIGDPVQKLPKVKFKVIALHNDYLIAGELLPDGTMSDMLREIAKPEWLRHGPDGDDATQVKRYYAKVTGVTTLDANEIEATDGTDTEEWEIDPRIIVGGLIQAAIVDYSGAAGSPAEGEEEENDLKWELIGPYAWKVKP
ncbi:MAG: hypothetical protein AAGL98_03635 [Planctomycetota bacterium]